MPGEARDDVDATELLHRLLDQLSARLRVGDVRLNRNPSSTELLRGLHDRVRRCSPAVVLDGNIGAFSSEFEDCRAADPAASAGDEGDPAVETTHGDPSLSPRNKSSERRSEEHTSELQSPYDLVCRLLLEKKKEKKTAPIAYMQNEEH